MNYLDTFVKNQLMALCVGLLLNACIREYLVYLRPRMLFQTLLKRGELLDRVIQACGSNLQAGTLISDELTAFIV